jgi:hypothetical protein
MGWSVGVALAVGWWSCGGTTTEGRLDSTGGELCNAEGTVCFRVEPFGLDESAVVRISPGEAGPAAALSPVWDISFAGGDAGPRLLKPATVSFSFDLIDAGEVPSELLLRLYTLAGGDWVALDAPRVDRVRQRVQGQVSHLSPFVVIRADRLPDGGLPVPVDAGAPDASVVTPPFDAGNFRHDAGTPDAGSPDAGRPDAGAPDAGPPDAGPPDAGRPDAGPPDAGPPDAGPPDAGPPDAGPPDAGPPDAGPPDAGPPDAGPPDAGLADGGADAG